MRKYYRFTRRKIKQQNLKDLILSKNETPLQKSLAVALGVFIGVLPIWGAQVASAILSAQFLKLNKPLAIIATHINFTPLFPIIVFFSLKIGFTITGHIDAIPSLSDITLTSAKTYFWMYLLGCLPIAVITGILFGSLTYFGLKFSTLRLKKAPIKSGSTTPPCAFVNFRVKD